MAQSVRVSYVSVDIIASPPSGGSVRSPAREGEPRVQRRLLMIEQQCVRMAWEAMELMFRTAGSSSAASSAPLGRYFRNLAVIRTHITLQIDRTAVNAARLHFGMPAASPL